MKLPFIILLTALAASAQPVPSVVSPSPTVVAWKTNHYGTLMRGPATLIAYTNSATGKSWAWYSYGANQRDYCEALFDADGFCCWRTVDEHGPAAIRITVTDTISGQQICCATNPVGSHFWQPAASGIGGFWPVNGSDTIGGLTLETFLRTTNAPVLTVNKETIFL